MSLLIIVSVLHGFSKVSQGRIFYENPQYIKCIGIAKWLLFIYLAYNAHYIVTAAMKMLVTIFLADMIGKGIFKVFKK